MWSDEEIDIIRKKRMIYLLDTFDAILDELIDEFSSVGQPLLSSLFAGMRLHMYIHGEKLGIKNENRAIKLESMRDKMIEQQRICTEILRKSICKEEDENG